MNKPPRARYRTTNWPAYNALLKRRSSLMVWLDPELAWQAAPSGRAGRPAVFSDAAIQFCLTLEMHVRLEPEAGHRPDRESAQAGPVGLERAPDYSTLLRRQKTLSVAITARPSRGGLHLLIDSTGVTILG